ncbi:MAG: peptide chain release factor 3 [Puniceicoccales bacterium]|jgi:peptide chain release factor 3|nr:peptide chain release factor 3 [Puniceicoccales bacterium]
MTPQQEISRRRTFAIISHPDAGKTTLTEKLLLYGGALTLAGAVKSRKNQQATTSDFMELEKQRGISVSSTVLQFEYRDCAVNLLDTPGHRDFSEDTYRVLTAVDAAVMVLDAARGIQEQTLKLFQVCRRRGIPIFTFVNKCDRPGKNPVELLDEIEKTLDLPTCPVTWPIGEGTGFHGVYDRLKKQAHWFERTTGGARQAPVTTGALDAPSIRDAMPAATYSRLCEDVELLDMAGTAFDPSAILAGRQTPVYFGSAIHNFGVQLLLDGFLDYAPLPGPRTAGNRIVHPDDAPFSAFIFKIQANMDPRHRDRLAFLRICSGRFTRDMQVTHCQSGKKVRLAFSHQLFGQERETVNEAWPGDVLGVTGLPDFGIGDTLSEDPGIVFDAIPPFAPECFALLHSTDTGSFKRFRAGLDQLLQEKVVQRFTPADGGSVPLLGAVGPLQFDVVAHRLQSEYNASIRLENAPWTVARWVDTRVPRETFDTLFLGGAKLVLDSRERLVLLFASDWNADYFQRENPSIPLYPTPDLLPAAEVVP